MDPVKRSGGAVVVAAMRQANYRIGAIGVFGQRVTRFGQCSGPVVAIYRQGA